jgi:hypothetical protein
MATRATSRLAVLALAALTTTAGCASTPTGPSVLVLPGHGKSHEQFLAEDSRCRQAAAAEVQTAGRGSVRAQNRYDMAYMQCMYAAGNQIPIPGGARSRDVPAAAPAAPRPPKPVQ